MNSTPTLSVVMVKSAVVCEWQRSLGGRSKFSGNGKGLLIVKDAAARPEHIKGSGGNWRHRERVEASAGAAWPVRWGRSCSR